MFRYVSMALLATGCATAAAPNGDVLLAQDRAFDAASAARGMDGFLPFIADDVALLPEGEPLQHGRDTLRSNWAPLLASPGQIRWTPVEAHLAASGELGYTLGTYVFHAPDGDHHGKYLTVWRRGDDGRWRIVADVGTRSPAPP